MCGHTHLNIHTQQALSILPHVPPDKANTTHHSITPQNQVFIMGLLLSACSLLAMNWLTAPTKATAPRYLTSEHIVQHNAAPDLALCHQEHNPSPFALPRAWDPPLYPSHGCDDVSRMKVWGCHSFLWDIPITSHVFRIKCKFFSLPSRSFRNCLTVKHKPSWAPPILMLIAPWTLLLKHSILFLTSPTVDMHLLFCLFLDNFSHLSGSVVNCSL